MLLFALFPKNVTDAWSTAWRLPNLFRRLLGEGSLSVAFLPVYVKTKVQDPSGETSRKLLNSFWTLLCLVLVVLTALGTVFAEQVLQIFLQENFQQDASKFAMTVHFAQIMFCFIFFVSVYAFWMAVLNSIGKFGWAAMAPTFFNVAMIASTVTPQSWFAVPGEALAWGVVVGGILQAAVLIPQLLRHGLFPRFSLHFRVPQIGAIFRALGPSFIGMGLLQVTTLVNLYFASSLAEGSISYIYLADRLLELPLSLVSVSLGTALLPTLSRFWAEDRKTEMITTLRKTLFLNLFLAFPAALGLLALADPIVEVLFRWGKFGGRDVWATANVLQVYSMTLLASSLVRVFVPAFYAIHNTWWPALASGISLAMHWFLAPVLMAAFPETAGAPPHAGLVGLVFSSSLSAFLNFIVLLLGFRWFIGHLEMGKMFKELLALLVAGAVLFAGALLTKSLVFSVNVFLLRAGILFAGISICAALYLYLASVLGVADARTLVQKFLSRIRR